jgi:hypothetical protein
MNPHFAEMPVRRSRSRAVALILAFEVALRNACQCAQAFAAF